MLYFEQVCPQFAQIDSNKFDAPLFCPICGTRVTNADGSVVETFCEHVLFFGTTELGFCKYNTSTGIDEDFDLEFNSQRNFKTVLLDVAEVQNSQIHTKALQFFRSLSKNCVIFCHNHTEQGHLETEVSDCMAIRYPSTEVVPTVGDWLDEQ